MLMNVKVILVMRMPIALILWEALTVFVEILTLVMDSLVWVRLTAIYLIMSCYHDYLKLIAEGIMPTIATPSMQGTLLRKLT